MNAIALSTPNIETHYNAIGREILLINPPDQEGILTQTRSQYLPLRKKIIDENNKTKTYINDGLERLIEVHEENKNEIYITLYKYNLLDNLIKIADAQNNIKTMSYDGLGRKTRMRDPDRGQMLYEYDDAGNLIKTIDNKGQVILYTYDGANRMVSEDYLDETGITPDVSYHYDVVSDDYPDAGNLKGALSYVKDQSGTQFLSYDQRGNIAWTVKRLDQYGLSSDYKTTMTYDAMDRVMFMTYPDGDVVHYTYNSRSLLESIPGVVEDIDYAVSGNLASIIYANAVKTQYTYDPRQRLIQLETKNIPKGDEILQHLHYTLDGVGNITTITDGRDLPQDSPKNATQGFQYDDLCRLTQTKGEGFGVINFQYDRIGNMIFKKSPDILEPGHIDDQLINLGNMGYGGTGGSIGRKERLPGDPPGPHAITSTESGLQYDYDDNGNMIKHAHGDTYTWDFKDRLIRVQKENTDTHYVYDYTGQRIIKKVTAGGNEKTTLYISDEYEIREGRAIKYIFAGNRRISRIEGKIPRSGEQEQQNLTFYPGWNFFSLLIEPEDPDIGVVLDAIDGDFTEVWAFDPLYDEYKGYVPEEGIYDLTELHAQNGYLIKVTSHINFIVSGIRKTDNISLSAGWNLIACPSNKNLLLKEALAGIKGKFKSVWSYDTINGKWKCFDPSVPVFLNDLTMMEPGKAYWVEMTVDNQLNYINKDTDRIYFYHPDHLGSSNLITDIDGAIIESTEFYPFGRSRYEEGADFDSAYEYTGKELDKESGLMYYGARYYDSVVGRFISEDFVEPDLEDPQALNLYVYCLNNPLKYFDPDGKKLKPVKMMGLTSDDPVLKERIYFLDEKIADKVLSFVKEARKKFSNLSVNNTFRVESSSSIKTSNTKAKGLSRHQGGFAIDLNGVSTLTKNQLKELNKIAAKHGLKPLKNQQKDLPHFDIDPIVHGYKSLKEAVNENKKDYEDITNFLQSKIEWSPDSGWTLQKNNPEE